MTDKLEPSEADPQRWNLDKGSWFRPAFATRRRSGE
jgi:hypothetical protein